jgi:Ser/Thr protein kinase RdoA (MazF antagonist)
MPRLLLTGDGKDHWIDPDGSFWRAISYIEDSVSFASVIDLDHAYEIGFALGLFHTIAGGLPADNLVDTLEGFHITPVYLRRCLSVLKRATVPPSPEVSYCMDFIDCRREIANVLEDAKADGRLPLRIIHGDPKVSNVMIDTRTRQAVSIVDLDTVKPGLVLYDIGDSLRSCSNPLGEDPGAPGKVRFDAELCRALLKGYFSAAEGFLCENECMLIQDSMRLLAFELGMRFFTDYLEGDVYFKVKDPRQNLRRALVQFHLVESIESQAESLRSIINEARRNRKV